MASGLVIAGDTTWESLRQQDKQQQGEQEKIDAQLKAAEGVFKTDTVKRKTEAQTSRQSTLICPPVSQFRRA